MIPLAVAIACWLLLLAFACVLAIAGSPDPRHREDDEVAELDAIWNLPARSPSRWWPPC